MTFGFPKPVKGSALVESRLRRRARVAAEQKEMQDALKRDERKCRVPRCEFASMKLPIDPAHLIHRGSGGNPKGDRTERRLIVALCRAHHGQFDAGEMEIAPLTEAMADGPLAFGRTHHETGEVLTFAVEKVIGVSETRA